MVESLQKTLQEWGPLALVAAAGAVWLAGRVNFSGLAGWFKGLLPSASPAAPTTNDHMATIGKALEVRAWLVSLEKTAAVEAFDARIWPELVNAVKTEAVEAVEVTP